MAHAAQRIADSDDDAGLIWMSLAEAVQTIVEAGPG